MSWEIPKQSEAVNFLTLPLEVSQKNNKSGGSK